jgi:hypothetical protein
MDVLRVEMTIRIRHYQPRPIARHRHKTVRPAVGWRKEKQSAAFRAYPKTARGGVSSRTCRMRTTGRIEVKYVPSFSTTQTARF